MTAHSCGDGGSWGYRDPTCVACMSDAFSDAERERIRKVPPEARLVTTCPTCGSPVRVVSSGEGTNHYEPAAAPAEGLRGSQLMLTPCVTCSHQRGSHFDQLACAECDCKEFIWPAPSAPAEGLREALEEVTDAATLYAGYKNDVDKGPLVAGRLHNAIEQARAALARHESEETE